MSSLVVKQPVVVTGEPMNCKNMLLSKRASFEKTAYQLKLACSKCSAESLRVVLMMRVIICQQTLSALRIFLCNGMQLSQSRNKKLLAIVYTAISKWQIDIKGPTRDKDRATAGESRQKQLKQTQQPLQLKKHTSAIKTHPIGLSLAVHSVCIFALLQMVYLLTWFLLHQTFWGIIFLVTWLYISYLLFSICNHERRKDYLRIDVTIVNSMFVTPFRIIPPGKAIELKSPCIAYYQRNLSKVKLL